MELFEILFILLFILFPLIDGLRRGRKQPPGPPGGSRAPGEARDRTDTVGPDGGDRGADRGAEPAAEMLPDDLWEVLTGERRTSEPSAPEEEEWAEPARVPDWQEPDPWEPEPSAPVGVEDDGWWRAPEPEPEPQPEPVEPAASAWDRGLEGRELPKIVSLEQPLPSPEARHRRFHRLIDQEEPAPVRRPSRVLSTLRDPDSLRSAFVLNEVLGPPKGLDP